MKSNFLKSSIAGVILAASFLTNVANAEIITVSETQQQTVDFQDFDFNFAISDWQSGTDASLYIEVQGDLGYSQGEISEDFELILESINLGTHGGFNDLGLGGWTQLIQGGVDQWKVSNTFAISAADMASVLFDNSFDLDVNFSDQVHIQFGTIGNVLPYVTVQLQYSDSEISTAVPTPSTLAILALGVFGLASRRFKK